MALAVFRASMGVFAALADGVAACRPAVRGAGVGVLAASIAEAAAIPATVAAAGATAAVFGGGQRVLPRRADAIAAGRAVGWASQRGLAGCLSGAFAVPAAAALPEVLVTAAVAVVVLAVADLGGGDQRLARPPTDGPEADLHTRADAVLVAALTVAVAPLCDHGAAASLLDRRANPTGLGARH